MVKVIFTRSHQIAGGVHYNSGESGTFGDRDAYDLIARGWAILAAGSVMPKPHRAGAEGEGPLPGADPPTVMLTQAYRSQAGPYYNAGETGAFALGEMAALVVSGRAIPVVGEASEASPPPDPELQHPLAALSLLLAPPILTGSPPDTPPPLEGEAGGGEGSGTPPPGGPGGIEPAALRRPPHGHGRR